MSNWTSTVFDSGRIVSRWEFLALLLLAMMARPIQAADALIENVSPPAAIALARYTANQGQTARWPVETIRIDASLPKLAKNGRFRAVRQLPPLGRPQYQVLETAGDYSGELPVPLSRCGATRRQPRLRVSNHAAQETRRAHKRRTMAGRRDRHRGAPIRLPGQEPVNLYKARECDS